MAETIGRQLKQAREARNLTIEKVVQATHIRARNLEALEADDFESLPSPVQARAFLRMYAEFLGLSLDDLISRQRESAAQSNGDSRDGEAISIPTLGTGVKKSVGVSPQPDDEASGSSAVAVPKTDGKKPAGFFSRLTKSRPKVKTQPPSDAPHDENLAPADQPGIAPATEADEGEMESESPPSPVENTPAPALPTASQGIFNAIGQTLRQRRESLSLTLDEIERHTHVRKHYLQALEAGEFDRLPSSVQTRGMLNNYARFLDMDVDALLLKFAEGLQTQRLERQPKPDESERKTTSKRPLKINLPPNLRRFLSMDILVGVGLVVLLLVFTIWGANQIISMRSASTLEPTAPSISNLLANSPEALAFTPTLTIQAGAGTVFPSAADTLAMTLPSAGQGSVQVLVVAQQGAWVRVTVDKKVQFEGRVTPGTAYPFSGNSQIEVLTGNGSAISILYNQSNLGAMGTVGEVVDHIYTANAILSPTATFTPTPTITPVPSRTLRPSPTLRPSLTPRSSPIGNP